MFITVLSLICKLTCSNEAVDLFRSCSDTYDCAKAMANLMNNSTCNPNNTQHFVDDTLKNYMFNTNNESVLTCDEFVLDSKFRLLITAVNNACKEVNQEYVKIFTEKCQRFVPFWLEANTTAYTIFVDIISNPVLFWGCLTFVVIIILSMTIFIVVSVCKGKRSDYGNQDTEL